MPTITIGTIIKLLVASIVVGALMAWLDVRPNDLVQWVGDTARDLIGGAFANLQSLLSYMLLGAVIVVPIWLATVLWKSLSRR